MTLLGAPGCIAWSGSLALPRCATCFDAAAAGANSLASSAEHRRCFDGDAWRFVDGGCGDCCGDFCGEHGVRGGGGDGDNGECTSKLGQARSITRRPKSPSEMLRKWPPFLAAWISCAAARSKCTAHSATRSRPPPPALPRPLACSKATQPRASSATSVSVGDGGWMPEVRRARRFLCPPSPMPPLEALPASEVPLAIGGSRCFSWQLPAPPGIATSSTVSAGEDRAGGTAGEVARELGALGASACRFGGSVSSLVAPTPPDAALSSSSSTAGIGCSALVGESSAACTTRPVHLPGPEASMRKLM